MAQSYVSQSPGYEQKASLVGFSSAMSEKVSRIPQIPTMRNNNRTLKPGVSRLELMRDNYEKKLLREKEQRLKEIRTQNRERLCIGGTVREFFAERRAMEASAKENKNSSALPPIDLHFKQMKEQKHREISSSEGSPQTRTFQNWSNPQTLVQPVAASKKPEVFSPQAYGTQHVPYSRNKHGRYLPPKKRSAGVDKQNPLPPLHQGVSNTYQPPTPNKRYETHANLETKEEPVHIPKPPVKRKQHIARTVNKQVAHTFITNQTTSDLNDYDYDDNDFRQEESPLPNLSKVKALRTKRLSQQKLNATTSSKNVKLTDFQKWQMEQDDARQERLDKHNKKKYSENYEDDVNSVTVREDLAQQEKELLEMINAEKNRLQAIQRQREELDEQERIEKEEEEKWKKQNEEYFTASKLKEKNFLQEKKRKVPTPEPLPDQETDVEIVPGPSVDFYEQKAMLAQGPQDLCLDLSPCSICGRKFAKERLAKHEKVCEQSSKKKRKQFDMIKQRALGQEHEQYVKDGKYKLEPEKKVSYLYSRFIFMT